MYENIFIISFLINIPVVLFYKKMTNYINILTRLIMLENFTKK